MALRHPIEYDESNESHDFIMPPEEARAFFEREVRRLVGMDPDEFIRRYEAGEFAEIEDVPDNWNIFRAAFLIPFGKAHS